MNRNSRLVPEPVLRGEELTVHDQVGQGGDLYSGLLGWGRPEQESRVIRAVRGAFKSPWGLRASRVG